MPAIKILDSDLCPCGQGQLYIDCCKRIISRYGFQAIKTTEALNEILGSSTSLKKYYNQRCSPYEKKIIFGISSDNENPSTNLCNAVDEATFYHMVIFDGKNIGRARSSIIAHEFEHIVLQERKFPVVFAKRRRYEDIARHALNLMEDPLIYPAISSFFDSDVKDDLTMNVNGFIKQIRNNGSLPLHDFHLFFNNSFCCARAHLMQRAYFRDHDHYGLYGFLTNIAPDVVPEVDYIVGVFEKEGYNTPEKQRKVFSELIQHYKLNGCLKILTAP